MKGSICYQGHTLISAPFIGTTADTVEAVLLEKLMSIIETVAIGFEDTNFLHLHRCDRLRNQRCFNSVILSLTVVFSIGILCQFGTMFVIHSVYYTCRLIILKRSSAKETSYFLFLISREFR